MNQFYAAFIPGLQSIAEKVLKERLSDVVINKLLDGAVIFETKTSYDKLNFFIFNNIFAVVSITERTHTGAQRHGERREEIIGEYIKKIVKDKTPCNSVVNLDTISNNSKSFKTFRIVVSNENQPAAINEKLRKEAEQYISNISGLKVDRSLPDTEFWFLQRSENITVFMKRLTLRSSWDKTLHKGELPPPLAWTLCYLADLKHSDTVLDPFCGYGSIPQAAIKHFHITNFLACDINSEAVLYTAGKFKNKCGFVLHKRDFSELALFAEENSIDAIVTDPPWGQFDNIEINGFYKKMFDVFYKLLKDNGRAVVLCANESSIINALPPSFEHKLSVSILLSGKKAVILIFNKKNRTC